MSIRKCLLSGRTVKIIHTALLPCLPSSCKDWLHLRTSGNRYPACSLPKFSFLLTRIFTSASRNGCRNILATLLTGMCKTEPAFGGCGHLLLVAQRQHRKLSGALICTAHAYLLIKVKPNHIAVYNRTECPVLATDLRALRGVDARHNVECDGRCSGCDVLIMVLYVSKRCYLSSLSLCCEECGQKAQSRLSSPNSDT